jgi:glycosyltransferase involved in cell wall biosynthesis
MTKLSLLVPCYNCEATLEDAISSIFSQAPVFPFDITMVDDGSTDSTFEVMKMLARRHRGVRLVRHTSNRGGGAARNTAVAHSDGDLLFCVDGDDILGPGFLENMTRFWSRRKCDGLGMSTSIKFRGGNTKNVAYVSEFEGPGSPVRFEWFLDGAQCSLGVVFLMTRAAYERVGGYPTEHGFDTQGMAFRFLCNGLSAYTCPDTVYYHRVGLPKSYYKREQQAGRINWNWFNVFDEFLYVFCDAVKARLLEHDLFEVPGRPAPDDLLKVVAGKRGIYASGYRSLISSGPGNVAREYDSARDRYKLYWLGNFHRLNGRYAKALVYYARALALGFHYRSIFYRMLQAELGLSASGMQPAEALEELALYSQPFPAARRPIGQRLFHRMMSRENLRRPALAMKSLRDRLGGRKRG